MNRKLQVFISSTFKDLKTERQAAVEAVLDAGHIPAGMELFTASDRSQLEVIRRWIDESDVFMLILGVRYGSLEPESKKSYTRCEYEYAIEQNKAVFAVYLSQAEYDRRLPELVKDIEGEDRTGYTEFRASVKGKLCSEFRDERDIKLAVFKTLKDFEQRRELQKAGWVRSRDVPDTAELVSKIERLSDRLADLTTENSRLVAENETLGRKLSVGAKHGSEERIGRFTFHELKSTLDAVRVKNDSLLDIFIECADDFVMGVADPAYDAHKESSLKSRMVYGTAVPKLITFGLMKRGIIKDGPPGVMTTEEGDAFLARLTVEYVREHHGLVSARALVKKRPLRGA